MANPTRAPRNRSGTKAPVDIRSVFRKRTEALVQRLSEQASDQTIAAALEAPSDFGGLARLLSDMAPFGVSAEMIDPLAEAIARGAEVKQELLAEAGGGWSSTRVAGHLGISRQAVDKRRRKRQLLAVLAGNGVYLYPVCQFTNDGVLPGLDRYLAAFSAGGGWTWLDVLLAPAEEIGGISPLQALQRGDAKSAAVAAAMYGEQGGPVDVEG
jgi:hypothetical protein